MRLMSRNSKLLTYISLVVITLLGLFFRLNNILETSNIYLDPARDIIIAKKIVNGEASLLTKPLANGYSVLENTPLYYWIISIFWIIGQSMESVIILNAVSLSLLPIIIFFIGKELVDEKLGLWLAFFFSIGSYFIRLSRWVWQPNLLGIFVPLVFLFFLYIQKKLSKKHMLLFFIFLNLAMHLHLMFFPSAIIMLTIIVFRLIKKYLKTKNITQNSIIFLLFSFASIGLRVFGSINTEKESNFFKIIKILFIPSSAKLISNFEILFDSYVKSFYVRYYSIQKNELFLILLILILISITRYFYLITKKKKIISKKFTLQFNSLLILNLGFFINMLFSGYTQPHFFLPNIFFYQLLVFTILFLLLRSKKIIPIIVSLIISIYITHTHLVSNSKIIKGFVSEISLFKSISKIIYIDSKNQVENISLETHHVYHDDKVRSEVYNSSLWYFLEEISGKKLITVIENHPNLKKTNNNNYWKYYINIKYHNKPIEKEKINYQLVESFTLPPHNVSIFKQAYLKKTR